MTTARPVIVDKWSLFRDGRWHIKCLQNIPHQDILSPYTFSIGLASKNWKCGYALGIPLEKNVASEETILYIAPLI